MSEDNVRPAAGESAAKPSARAARKEPASFEEAVARLERLVARMESGGISLEEMLAGYEWCSDVLKKLEQQLAQAQQRHAAFVLDGV